MKKFISLAMLSLTAISFPSIAATAEGCTGTQPIVDKNVFNWRYYLNMNADLQISGINNATSACSHWTNQGAAEGRQAHAGFHSKQYLSRYPDVASYYGATNYTGAISHYINNGMTENRIGYIENGMNAGQSTATISGNFDGSKIFIGTSARSAGAVDSLIFDNIEFVNAMDHGRQIQLASASSYGGGYNPTEAGSCNDGKGFSTSSIIKSIYSSGGVLQTTSTPAFWNKPGNNTAYGCGIGNNTTTAATNHEFSKNITIGAISSLPGVIRFNSKFKINETVPQYAGSPYGPRLSLEIPTGYLSGNFNRVFKLTSNSSTTEITGSSCLINDDGCTSTVPLIYATPNLDYAMGICTGASSGAVFKPYEKYKAYGDLDPSSPFSSTTKWGIVKYIDANVFSGTTLEFSSYMAMAKSNGSSSALERAMSSLATLNQLGYCY